MKRDRLLKEGLVASRGGLDKEILDSININ